MNKLDITIVGAGGKMGTRITENLKNVVKYNLHLVENSPEKAEIIRSNGLVTSDAETVIPQSDVVILAVPDILIGNISNSISPLMKTNSTLLTLDPAAAYANLINLRDDITSVVAHPCHPSVFGKFYTEAEHNDVFGGIAAEQDVVIAKHQGDDGLFNLSKEVVKNMYSPVGKIHTITVKQMAILEPTLAEVVTCMVGTLLKESLDEVTNMGVPKEAAEAMLYGHIQIALAVALKGTNPFSDACLIAIDYGKNAIIKDDWKRVFDDSVLDDVVSKMLKLESGINN